MITNILDGSDSIKSVSEYPTAQIRAEHKVEEETDSEYKVFSQTVSENTELLDVKDKLYDKNIVLIDISGDIQIEKNRLLSQIEETVNDINGDVVLYEEEKLIAVPDNIHISRN